MYKKAKPLFMHCQSPMHAGSGSDLGIVDLPIQRERHTSFPKIESSSLKGALREAVEHEVLKDLKSDKSNKEDILKKVKDLNRVFGFDDSDLRGLDKGDVKTLFGEKEKDFAGAIGFTDARLLLFPIKSMKGVFAWATCPKILKQLETDMKLTDGNNDFSLDIPDAPCVATNSKLVVGSGKVILEEYTFSMKDSEKSKVDALAVKLASQTSISEKELKAKLIILPDDDFKDFVNLSTEVITRTKIDNNTGTVATGALFTEEYLPAESVMYSLVMAHDEFREGSNFKANDVMQFFNTNLPEIVQIGGNATLGKGLTKVVKTAFSEAEKETQPTT